MASLTPAREKSSNATAVVLALAGAPCNKNLDKMGKLELRAKLATQELRLPSEKAPAGSNDPSTFSGQSRHAGLRLAALGGSPRRRNSPQISRIGPMAVDAQQAGLDSLSK